MLSGKFVLRLEPDLHRALKEEASRNGESLNQLCNRKLNALGDVDPDIPLGEILKTFSPLGVLLFGSVARGQATEKSDTDLLIVLKSTTTVDRKLYKRWDELGLSDKFSPQFVILPKQDEPVGSLWLENAVEGKVLYDTDNTIQKTLRNIREDIAQGFYLKKISHGQSYWVRREKNAK